MARPAPTILLVDDDRQLLSLGQELLEHFGYRVLVAGDAQEALAIFQTAGAEIDLVILDYYLPGLPGLELLATLRQLHPHVKIIIASGFFTPEEGRMLQAAGATALLDKPFRARQLQETIAQALAA